MDQTFGNWRSAVVGLGMAAAVVALGLAVAFW
jgi:anti-sigma-K factor RskA